MPRMNKSDKELTIVIPMAGRGARFAEKGYPLPKPFIDVDGQMMIERVLNGVKIPGARLILIIQQLFQTENAVQLERLSQAYDVEIVSVSKVTMGACCTGMAAHRLIDGDKPVLFVDSDNLFFADVIDELVADAHARELDGSLLTVSSQNPAFSYVRIDEAGCAQETREKTVISDHAICGAYYFSRGSDFVDSAIQMMMYGDTQKNEYYMSNVFNYLIQAGKKVGIYEISPNRFACLGTPDQLEQYLNGRQS